MVHRAALPLLFLILLAITPVPSSAAAHGPRLRGVELDANVTLTASAGIRKQTWRWYTIGLRPGTLEADVRITSCGQSLVGMCSLEIDLVQSGHTLTMSGATCSGSGRPRCNAPALLRYQVRRAGVYYLVISGMGGLTVSYTMRVRGNIYPLHCRKYC